MEAEQRISGIEEFIAGKASGSENERCEDQTGILT